MYVSFDIIFSLTGCGIARKLILQMLADPELIAVNVDQISGSLQLLAVQFSSSHSELKFTVARLLFECWLLCGEVMPFSLMCV